MQAMSLTVGPAPLSISVELLVSRVHESSTRTTSRELESRKNRLACQPLDKAEQNLLITAPVGVLKLSNYEPCAISHCSKSCADTLWHAMMQ
eukprot:179665-Amphidinium_carterae.1